jgi:type II secretory ATPase GspE/PulE/Tfp pilus assembly ATPase PilB-like protein
MKASQIFQLIDTILPLEVCLYHQVVPLLRQEKSLHLGMVDPQDSSALDYVKRMLSHLNAALIPQQISAEQHKSILSSYLKYKDQEKTANEPASVGSGGGATQHKAHTHQKVQDDEEITLIQQPAAAPKPQIPKPPQPTSSQKLPTKPAQTVKPDAAPIPPNLPILRLQAVYLSQPLPSLLNLAPKQFFQELLARVLLEGIGRLFFEAKSEKGRVLWSQEGVLQSVLEDVPMPMFQAVVQELKLFFNLPFVPVDRPKQVEMERLYNKNHILLVLQVTPGTLGEEATLQVLRGAALRFYQEQKLADLSQDALNLAQQLQRKLHEIGSRFDPSFSSESLYALPAIDQLIKQMDEQLRTFDQ